MKYLTVGSVRGGLRYLTRRHKVRQRPSKKPELMGVLSSHYSRRPHKVRRRQSKISELMEDLIVAILMRLPIKKIVQCKIVSKQWYKLINSPTFAYRRACIQTYIRNRVPCFLILSSLATQAFANPLCPSSIGKLTKYSRINLPTRDDDLIVYNLFHAGYGIFCLFEFFSGNVLVWNPSTREHHPVPPSPYFSSFGTNSHSFGILDYKDGNFSYKIGRVACTSTPFSNYMSMSLELYSSETKCWKHFRGYDSGQFFGYSDGVHHCANLNGRAHWVFQSATEDTYITTFDYKTEQFGRIKIPSPSQVGSSYDKRKCLITLYDGKFLCLGLSRKIQDECSHLDIWVMLKYGDESSWTKYFNVGPIAKNTEVLQYSRKLRGLFLYQTHSPTVLKFLDCKSSKIKSYHYDMAPTFRVRGWLEPQLQVVEHVESFVSLLK